MLNQSLSMVEQSYEIADMCTVEGWWAGIDKLDGLCRFLYLFNAPGNLLYIYDLNIIFGFN
jgi:hypothetical protein